MTQIVAYFICGNWYTGSTGINGFWKSADNHEMSSYKEKKRKIAEEEAKLKEVTSVIVQFQTADVLGKYSTLIEQGERKGPQIDIPSNSSPSQLEVLLNQLIESEEPVPFAFYINDNEISTSVGETLREIVGHFGFQLLRSFLGTNN